MCAVIAKKHFLFLNAEKSFLINSLYLVFIIGVSLWLSTFARPCPGICLITVPILFLWKLLIQTSPILETSLKSLEKERSPIMLLAPLALTSKTGRVLILAPINLSKCEVLLTKML
mgnify:CR=1 FL=1